MSFTADHRQIAAYNKAMKERGTKEIPGAKHNPKVIDWFKQVGHGWVTDDETSWCAAFVGAMLELSGAVSTRALNARSYLEWGEEVDLKDAKPGDIVVFWRESPDSWKGHVAFYVSHTAAHIRCLGGNQKNRVGIDNYSAGKLLSVRRMRATLKPTLWQQLIALALKLMNGWKQ